MRRHHSLFIFDSKATSSNYALYRKINQYISQGFAVIYAAAKESDPNKALAEMIKSGLVEEPEDKIQSGALYILSTGTVDAYPLPCYSSSDKDYYKLVSSMIQKIKRQVGEPRFKGILVIADASFVFDKTKSLIKLLMHEKSISQEQEKRRQGGGRRKRRQLQQLEVICCYRKETLDTLPMRYLVPIVSYHDSLLSQSSGGDYKELDRYGILSIISRGINDIMGEGSHEIIFKTLKYIYKIETNSVVANPALFEEKLQKVCGVKSAPLILDSIASRFREEIYRMVEEDSEGRGCGNDVCLENGDSNNNNSMDKGSNRGQLQCDSTTATTE